MMINKSMFFIKLFFAKLDTSRKIHMSNKNGKGFVENDSMNLQIHITGKLGIAIYMFQYEQYQIYISSKGSPSLLRNRVILGLNNPVWRRNP